MQNEPEYTVTFKGVEVKCADIAHVVETVRALVPLEQEVAVPRQTEPQHVEFNAPSDAEPIVMAVRQLVQQRPDGLRPVEIVRALKRRRVPGVKYTKVYSVLRYGEFEKRDGRWTAPAR